MKSSAPALFAPARPYKGFEPVMGVWVLRNTVNGKVLLGASPHTKGAINKHLFTLRLGRHPNAELQRDWREHGEEGFTAEVLHVLERRGGRREEDDRRDLAELERLCLEELQPYGEAGYHSRPVR